MVDLKNRMFNAIVAFENDFGSRQRADKLLDFE